MEHRGKTDAEQHAAQHQLRALAGGHGALVLLGGQCDPPGRGEQTEHRQHHKACQCGGHGKGEKLARGKAVAAVEIQVLGVAHRGEHAAQIGGHRLQAHHPGQQPALAAGGQHQHRKGHKGDEGHVVGDQHGGEKAEHHQHQAQPLAAAAAFDQRRRHPPEGPGLLHTCHHCHQTVKQGQHPAVHITQVCRVRRDYQAGGQRQHRRDGQHRFAFQPLHRLFHRPSTSFFSTRKASSSPLSRKVMSIYSSSLRVSGWST